MARRSQWLRPPSPLFASSDGIGAARSRSVCRPGRPPPSGLPATEVKGITPSNGLARKASVSVVLSVLLVVMAMAVVVCSHPYSRGAFPSRGDVKRGKSGAKPALSRSCHRRPSAAEARMPASATMPSTFARKGAGSPSQMARVVPCRFRGQGFFFVNDPALKGEA